MGRHFRESATAIFRPVVVNLLTAFFLFAFAIVFKADILRLFGLDRADGYPIVCAAEMYRAPDSEDGVWLDFYLINNSGDQFDTRNKLVKRLKELNPDPDLVLSPDVRMTVNEDLGADGFRLTAEMDQTAAAYNRGKGEATASLADDGKTLIIRLNKIGAYNVLRATVAIDGFTKRLGDNRGLVPSIPIRDRADVFERCYTVKN